MQNKIDRNFLTNKTVVITGASAGVGAATARLFARLGANLVLAARRESGLDLITAELELITSVHTIAMDVRDEQANKELLFQAEKVFGSVDVLINNAGFHQRGDVIFNNACDLTEMVDVNLRAPIQLTTLALTYMNTNKWGAIINVGSLAGRTPLQGAATYAATKAALRSFTYSLADELQMRNIKIGIVSPGPIDTGFIMENIDHVEDIVFSQPMSSAKQVAEAILDLVLGDKIEICLPKRSGWLTTISYLFPRLRRALRPAMYRKGRKNKEKYRNR